ncbi:Fic family protein [Veillonellaceae bacterium DNF00626]|nr:Fic family protein [Veillonellaceae bacterium DNF00626]
MIYIADNDIIIPIFETVGEQAMRYQKVTEIAAAWGISERSVRKYCAEGKIIGAVLDGKTWKIPENAVKPARKKRTGKRNSDLLTRLRREKESAIPGGIYHKIQIELTYNSNRMEGSRLSHDQTRYIFETNTIGVQDKTVNVDDVVETANHFRCIDLVIELANYRLSESLIKQLHGILKSGTSDSRKAWFAVGDYKRLENEVGGNPTAKPENVAKEIKQLLKKYNAEKNKTIYEIIEFHYEFEKIHPFQDGNGRVGRLIMFKECLRNGITPFIIEDDMKEYYYRGLKEWKTESGYLTDTCLAAQDRFKEYMDYFGLKYSD